MRALGRARLRAFFGEHEVEATLPSGETLTGAFRVRRRGERKLDMQLHPKG
jgi:hypothetical protein